MIGYSFRFTFYIHYFTFIIQQKKPILFRTCLYYFAKRHFPVAGLMSNRFFPSLVHEVVKYFGSGPGSAFMEGLSAK